MLNLEINRLPDPDGHNPALLLRGDWLVVAISDGERVGYGEASHSRDDDACAEAIRRLFDLHVKNLEPEVEAVEGLPNGAFARAESFVVATAISGINQALFDLAAKRENVPVWRLFSDKMNLENVPAYATINRALTTRTLDDYAKTAEHALRQGFTAIKCAPFEAVTPNGEHLRQSEYGLKVLSSLRSKFPELSVRIDFHKRFRLETFKRVLPALRAVSPTWLEEPIPIGPEYGELKRLCETKIALGELYFGSEGFADIAENGWADVIMPDVKHVGGFGPLLNVARRFGSTVEISPHNPSGPIATAASLHAAATVPGVTSLELPLIIDDRRAYYLDGLRNGRLRIPDGPGWGGDAAKSLTKNEIS